MVPRGERDTVAGMTNIARRGYGWAEAVRAVFRAGAVAGLVFAGGRAAAQESGPEWRAVLGKGFNSLHADAATGAVFASNGRVIKVSRDQGANWTDAVEEQKAGRHFNATGFHADPRGKRAALFPIDSPVGWFTVDSGAAWTAFPKPGPPQVRKHDGWTFGAVDWSAENPVRFVAKEHHSTRYWMSQDAGKAWAPLEGFTSWSGIGFGPDGALLLGGTSDKQAKNPAPGKGGIYRSADGGGTWTLVWEGEFEQKVRPVVVGESVFWPAKNGVAASPDGGRTWSMLPGSPAGATIGPIVGAGVDAMILVSPAGVHRTADGGKSWTLAVAKEGLPKPVAGANLGTLMAAFAWDAAGGRLYCSASGSETFAGALK